eukprot:TRINITY_DN3738_c0_g1_i1.p2 TRINITY_DN3738_c0_g1~~TRINITY_DN3738_c0_g1_i1.p2  ORF type:complete len:307 (-),score=63.48 TRINITY_DN3738_c0_g1_i1:109-1029(-)
MMKSARAALPDGCPVQFVGQLRERSQLLVRLIDSLEHILEKKSRAGTTAEQKMWYKKRISQVNRPRRFRNPKKPASDLLLNQYPTNSSTSTQIETKIESSKKNVSKEIINNTNTNLPIAYHQTAILGVNNKACTSCGVTQSPEWRKGPKGAATLCNACGLHYAKNIRAATNSNNSKSALTSIALHNNAAFGPNQNHLTEMPEAENNANIEIIQEHQHALQVQINAPHNFQAPALAPTKIPIYVNPFPTLNLAQPPSPLSDPAGLWRWQAQTFHAAPFTAPHTSPVYIYQHPMIKKRKNLSVNDLIN